MSSFAEQLAARAAKRTGGGGGDSNSISSPSRSENLNNGSSSNGSSPSRAATSLSEQIKSRAVDINHSGRSNTNGGADMKSISSSTPAATTVSTDETLFKSSSTPQKPIQQNKQTLPSKKSSSSLSSRSKRSNEGNIDNLSPSPSLQQQRLRADNNDLLDNSDHMDEHTTSYIPAKLNPTKPNSPKTSITTESTTITSPEQPHSTTTKLKAKLDKYKSENKKLRHESLLLKAKLEEMATLLSQLQQLEAGHKVENDELKVRCKDLSEKVLLLEMGDPSGGEVERDGDCAYEWNGIRSSIMKLREERTKQQQRRASLTTTANNNSKASMMSLDTFADMDKEDLVAENVRLTNALNRSAMAVTVLLPLLM